MYEIHELIGEHQLSKMSPLETWNFKIKSKEETLEFGKMLFANMMHHKGLGLSANQIGIPVRVFCISPLIYRETYVTSETPVPKKTIVFFNPIITRLSEKTVYMEEGCLTWPGLFVKVRRPEAVTLTYMNEEGNVYTETYTHLLGRVIQHEMDHMDGNNFLRIASPVHKQIAFQKRKKYLRQLKKMGEDKK